MDDVLILQSVNDNTKLPLILSISYKNIILNFALR